MTFQRAHMARRGMEEKEDTLNIKALNQARIEFLLKYVVHSFHKDPTIQKNEDLQRLRKKLMSGEVLDLDKEEPHLREYILSIARSLQILQENEPEKMKRMITLDPRYKILLNQKQQTVEELCDDLQAWLPLLLETRSIQTISDQLKHAITIAIIYKYLS